MAFVVLLGYIPTNPLGLLEGEILPLDCVVEDPLGIPRGLEGRAADGLLENALKITKHSNYISCQRIKFNTDEQAVYESENGEIFIANRQDPSIDKIYLNTYDPDGQFSNNSFLKTGIIKK